MNRTVWWIIGGVVGLGLIVLLALSIATEEPVDASIGYGDVTVEGTPLPVLVDTASDVAIGFETPAVSGADWNDVPVSIRADGRPKMIVLLAHWCPHCQNEVPVIQGWLDAGGKPDAVDIYAVATSTDPLRPNWPPQDWLESEGWTVPTILDDQIGTGAVAYGMRGTPFWVVLDGDNNTLVRVSGEVGLAGIEAMAQLALDSA